MVRYSLRIAGALDQKQVILISCLSIQRIPSLPTWRPERPFRKLILDIAAHNAMLVEGRAFLKA